MRWANVGFAEWCFTPAPKSFRLPPTYMACHCRTFGRPLHSDGAACAMNLGQIESAQGIADMFMARPPSFETIMTELEAMEKRINAA
jgi:hypothetical protein